MQYPVQYLISNIKIFAVWHPGLCCGGLCWESLCQRSSNWFKVLWSSIADGWRRMSPDNKMVNIDRSVASSGSGAREEEEHRMMASTTVFVLEPGVTALGIIMKLEMVGMMMQWRRKRIRWWWFHLVVMLFLPMPSLASKMTLSLIEYYRLLESYKYRVRWGSAISYST